MVSSKDLDAILLEGFSGIEQHAETLTSIVYKMEEYLRGNNRDKEADKVAEYKDWFKGQENAGKAFDETLVRQYYSIIDTMMNHLRLKPEQIDCGDDCNQMKAVYGKMTDAEEKNGLGRHVPGLGNITS